MPNPAPILALAKSDPLYPRLLKEIQKPPATLYVRGTLIPDEPCITIVGTRKPTAYGIECAQSFAGQLVSAGFTVVSGLAFGIDAAAHQAALDAGGRTIAVLGSGVDDITPRSNERIGLAIMKHGAVISEFPSGTEVQRFHFPQRDRIMSGLSLGTLVIEAGEQSGALITARNATEQGREVFAIPGPIVSHTSAGTNRLIQEGAKLVATVDDIMSEFGHLHLFSGHAHNVNTQSDTEQKICTCLTEPKTADTIAQETAMPIQEIRTALTLLELQRVIIKRADGYFQKTQ